MLSADVVRLPCEYVMRRFLPFSGRVLTLCVCAQVLSRRRQFLSALHGAPSLSARIALTALDVCVCAFSLYVPMVLTVSRVCFSGE